MNKAEAVLLLHSIHARLLRRPEVVARVVGQKLAALTDSERSVLADELVAIAKEQA